MNKNLELRMYGLVNYQLTGIQMGIQFLHAVVEYNQMSNKLGGDILANYNEWANIYKTVILLNGGTTNNNINKLGTLNQHLQTLKDIGVICSKFEEEDLGDQLTAIAFIVDERVFNREKYPDFEDFLEISKIQGLEVDKNYWSKYIIGGERNVNLREFLKKFRLA